MRAAGGKMVEILDNRRLDVLRFFVLAVFLRFQTDMNHTPHILCFWFLLSLLDLCFIFLLVSWVGVRRSAGFEVSPRSVTWVTS